MNLSRSKQKNERALNPRSLLSLRKKTRKKKKKKKGTPRVVDHRGVLLLHQTEPDPSFVRAQSAFCVVGAKKNASFFQGNFFFFWEKKKKKKKGKNVSAPRRTKKRNTKRAFGEV